MSNGRGVEFAAYAEACDEEEARELGMTVAELRDEKAAEDAMEMVEDQGFRWGEPYTLEDVPDCDHCDIANGNHSCSYVPPQKAAVGLSFEELETEVYGLQRV